MARVGDNCLANGRRGTENGKARELVEQAQEHLDEGEAVLATVMGTYETKKMGQDWTRKGILASTDHRLVFYAKKMGGYDLEVFPYEHLLNRDKQGDDGPPGQVLCLGK